MDINTLINVLQYKKHFVVKSSEQYNRTKEDIEQSWNSPHIGLVKIGAQFVHDGDCGNVSKHPDDFVGSHQKYNPNGFSYIKFEMRQMLEVARAGHDYF